MSRIGVQPVEVPSGVDVKFAGDLFSAKGPKGALELKLRSEVSITIDGAVVTVTRANDTREARAF
ncbi:MAG: 50S ribosomal protein L6, partial [Thermodesulfobacteriota bacterium]